MQQNPAYYELVPEPISIPHIRKHSEKKLVGYQSLLEYHDAWSRLFQNYRLAYGNNPDSSGLEPTAELQAIVNTVIMSHAQKDPSLPGAAELIRRSDSRGANSSEVLQGKYYTISSGWLLPFISDGANF